jgi:predicted DNA binding CopG/RHH family protein
VVELEQEEREILDAYQAGRLERVALSRDEIERYREAARAVSRKDKRINIRISAADVEDLQIKAMEEGMPYQTLIASVLHKYVTGKLVPSR